MFFDVAITLSLEMAIHFPGCLLISLSYFLISNAVFSKGGSPLRGMDIIL